MTRAEFAKAVGEAMALPTETERRIALEPILGWTLASDFAAVGTPQECVRCKRVVPHRYLANAECIRCNPTF